MIVTLTANPSVDLTYAVPALTRGELHRARAEPAEPSGKGVNVTRALVANGVASTAVFPCGGPIGQVLQGLLHDEHVPFVAVPVAGPVRVNVSVVEPDGSATKINGPGPTLSPVELHQFVTETLDTAGQATWLVASGSLPPGIEPGFYAEVGERAHRLGVRFALDTSGQALAEGLAARPEVVKPNLAELAELVARPLPTLGAAASAGAELLQRGAAAVMVSVGADGALLVTPRGLWHAEAPVGLAPAPVSTVGAGDALLAGLLAGWEARDELGPGALAEAVAWASASLRLPGSRVPVVTDADRHLVRGSDHPDPGRPLGTATIHPGEGGT